MSQLCMQKENLFKYVLIMHKINQWKFLKN